MELMDKKFRYTLTLDNTDYILNNAPKEWETETIGLFKRDLKYFGIIRSIGAPMQFVKEGADVLRSAFNKYGVEAGVRLTIEERNDDTINDIWGYTVIFRSDLDFSQYEYDGITATVTLLESGIGRDIKAKENIKYEFPLTGTDIVNVVLPGVNFSEKSTWITKYVDPNGLNAAKRYALGMDLVTNGFGSGFLTALNTNYRPAAPSDDFSNDAFVRCNRVGGVNTRITGNLKGYTQSIALQANNTFSVQIRSNKFPFIIQTLVTQNTGGGVAIYPFDVNFYFNWNMQEGEYWYIYVGGTVAPTANKMVVSEGEISIEYAAVSDPSNCKGIRPFDLLKRFMARISPAINVGSVFLNSVRKDLIFTSGSAIREISDAKIKMSFNDFFKTLYSLNDVGMGTDSGQFKLEEAVSFMRPLQLMDVGNVNSYSVIPALELMGNSVEIGYNDGNTDDENGRQEYNSGQVWALPLTTIQNALEWKSIARADQYGIEQMRVKFNVSKTATSDNKSDNDTFMIDCNPVDGEGNLKPILGSQLQSVTGLSFPLTAYNLLISPKHNLLNHSGYLRSILDRQDGKYIDFGSAEKNALINVTANGVNVDEDRAVQVSTLSDKYFQPYIFSINAKLPKTAIALIDSNPFGYITFNHNGTEASGYIMEVSVDLSQNGARDLKLLATDFSFLP